MRHLHFLPTVASGEPLVDRVQYDDELALSRLEAAFHRNNGNGAICFLFNWISHKKRTHAPTTNEAINPWKNEKNK